MDAEAPGDATDTSGNPEVAWWCKILTRLVASLAGFGELTVQPEAEYCVIHISYTVLNPTFVVCDFSSILFDFCLFIDLFCVTQPA